MAGYPGSIAATWQRAGRAGRRSGRSAAVLVASSAPIDQFVVRNPEYFFGASPEHALVNPDNLHILLDHVKCAAFELPFTAADTFGSINVQEILAVLAEEGFVHFVDGTWQWTQESYPANAVSLRSVTSDNFVVVDMTNDERVIGETDFTSGPSTLHEKAIYIVEGQLFQVERLDFDGRKAFVRAVECDYYTDAITHTKVTILETFAGPGASGTRHWAVRTTGEVTRVRLASAECLVPSASAMLSRRGARRLPRRRVQEDQVLHERERRIGRAGAARAGDAHDVVLADDSAGRAGGAARRHGGQARWRRRARLRDAQHRADAADVRSPRSRAVGGRRESRGWGAAGRTEARRQARGARGRADHLPVRQLSRRHRPQRAAVRACTKTWSPVRAS